MVAACRGASGRTLDCRAVAHPALGLPPRDPVGGFPNAAVRLRAAKARLGARGLEFALDADPTMRTRHDEIALRKLLRDTDVIIERIALCVAGDDPLWLREWADWVAPIYRRRRVPMDDVIKLTEGLRRACAAVLSPVEIVPAERAVEEAIRVFRLYRRLAGDARKRNPILQFIYKGA
jgi:hypothetical protein